jgi:hypothetical protein
VVSQEGQRAFFSMAQDERRFWLTRYESDHGPVYDGAHRLHSNKSAVAPFVSSAPVPKIPVLLRGREELTAVIDSSARSSWMTFDVAATRGLIPLGPPPVSQVPAHVGEGERGYLCVASRMQVPPVRVESALFYVAPWHGPLGPLLRGDAELDTPMVLGAEWLRAFHFVQLDYPARRVALATSETYEPVESRLVASVPWRMVEGHLVLDGLINGRPVSFLLDTLGDFAAAAPTAEWGRQANQVMLGDLVLVDVPLTDTLELNLGLPAVPRLGREVLSRVIVTFDGRRRMVHFERPVAG